MIVRNIGVSLAGVWHIRKLQCVTEHVSSSICGWAGLRCWLVTAAIEPNTPPLSTPLPPAMTPFFAQPRTRRWRVELRLVAFHICNIWPASFWIRISWTISIQAYILLLMLLLSYIMLYLTAAVEDYLSSIDAAYDTACIRWGTDRPGHREKDSGCCFCCGSVSRTCSHRSVTCDCTHSSRSTAPLRSPLTTSRCMYDVCILQVASNIALVKNAFYNVLSQNTVYRVPCTHKLLLNVLI